MDKPQQEQIKLLATYLNTIGAGIIVTGVIAPVAGFIINPGLSAGSFIYFGLCCFGLSLLLHGVAQAAIGMLPND